MKKIIVSSFVLLTGLFSSCTENYNPQPITNEFLAEVFEVKADFTSANTYRNFYKLNPVIFNSDVLLVYENAGVDKAGSDIWKALPQVYTSVDGIHQYNFDFTKSDFSIFLDSNFDPLKLNSKWRLNKIFRIVVVPGKFSKTLDKSNFQNVMNTLNLNENSVVDISN